MDATPPPLTIDDLRRPGPIRSAALAAAASSLRADLSVCRDRSRIAAARMLDRALDAADGSR